MQLIRSLRITVVEEINADGLITRRTVICADDNDGSGKPALSLMAIPVEFEKQRKTTAQFLSHWWLG
jgi:hypothetical protein